MFSSVLCWCNLTYVQRSPKLACNRLRGLLLAFTSGSLSLCCLCTHAGCFDQEEQAARAYDKMMLWCEIHNSAGLKSGIMNYDSSEYEKDLPWLQSVTQVRTGHTHAHAYLAPPGLQQASHAR